MSIWILVAILTLVQLKLLIAARKFYKKAYSMPSEKEQREFLSTHWEADTVLTFIIAITVIEIVVMFFSVLIYCLKALTLD